MVDFISDILILDAFVLKLILGTSVSTFLVELSISLTNSNFSGSTLSVYSVVGEPVLIRSPSSSDFISTLGTGVLIKESVNSLPSSPEPRSINNKSVAISF
ncbi:hypothetical protein FKM82_023309 [Ascaphus truei]